MKEEKSKKRLKLLLIAVSVGLILSALIVCLYLTDPNFEFDFFPVFSMVLSSVWAFFVPLALPFTVSWVKEYFERLTFEQSFRLGYYLGCGWGVIVFILLLAFSPVIGTRWFVQPVKAVRSSEKNRKERSEKPTKESDIFDI